MPTISVIVPTRKRHHLLPRALNSLLAQTFSDFEVIVVDDNPADSRVANVPALASLLKNSRIRLVEHDNPRNASAARNAGLRAAQGEWITYLDDDDTYRPAKLEKQIRAARESGLPIGTCGVLIHLGIRERMSWISAPGLNRKELLLNVPFLPLFFHRNAGSVYFDEQHYAGEDAYFILRVVHHFSPDHFFHVPEPLVDVYPQTDFRVNSNAKAIWEAMQAIHRDFGSQYSPDVVATFLLRMRLGFLKHQPGNWSEMSSLSLKLLRLRGLKEFRMIANAMLYKVPPCRKWLVS